jgi:hypothetical protein
VEGTRLTFHQTGFEGIQANIVRYILSNGWRSMSRVRLPVVLDQLERGGPEAIDLEAIEACEKDQKSGIGKALERFSARVSAIVGRGNAG